MTSKPLSGIRVLDFTAFPHGGMASVMLADLGAEVIRVEAPARKGEPSLVVWQVAMSRGKKSITLDMRNPDAAAVLGRLAPHVDVILENAPPGAMAKRGFGYDDAKAANPRLVWCSITGFGQDGPYARYAAHDISFIAHSGFLKAMSDDLPFFPSTSLSLQASAAAAIIGIQAALLQRVQTGEGSFVDIAVSEAMGWFHTASLFPLEDKAMIMRQTPDRAIYACADGRFVAVASAETKTWSIFCDALGLDDLKEQLHKWTDADGARARVAAILATRPAMAWVDELSPLGAAVMIVNEGKQVIDDVQVRHRGSVVEVAGAPVPANPVRLSSMPETMTLAPPTTIGNDTHAVLEAAGFSEAEIAAYEASGLI